MPVKPPEPEQIDVAEVERLIELAEQGRLEADGQQRVAPLLRTLVWLQWTLLETRMSLAKLKRLLFGKRTEKSKRKSQDPPNGSEEGGSAGSGQETGEGSPEGGPAPPPPTGGADAGADTPSDPPADTPSEPPAKSPSEKSGGDSPGKRPRGHGRLGVADYPGAEHIFCTHEALKPGDPCPTCERGRLYRSRPLVRLRFTAQPLALATCYELEQLRCGGCGALFVAHLPPEAGQETYDTSLKVNLVLAHRDPQLPPIQWMSDGLAANTPKTHKDLTLQINCIVHGRRNFVDINDFFPEQCAQVIEAIAQVYKHEAHCREQALTPQQRLAYHQQHSRAVMDELKAWMQKQFEDKRVEPNSRLGSAFNYLLKRWKSLTRFLEVPGAPLDNNTAERALKIILRLRKNSLFYKNEHGAYVGDVLISLIETCRLAGANPLHYFTALMENRSAVFRDPGAWLPWNYRESLHASAQGPPLSHLPPVLGQLDPLGVAVPQ